MQFLEEAKNDERYDHDFNKFERWENYPDW